MSTTVTSPRDRIVEALSELGGDPVGARDLAAKLVISESQVVELVAALEDVLVGLAGEGDEEDVDESLWGPSPSDEELAAARRDAHAAVNAALREQLAGALTRDEAAERLGVSPQAVSKRAAGGGLIALRRGRTVLFPAWQFHDDAVLAGLKDVIAAFPGTRLSLSVWATTPSADLDGRTAAVELTRPGGLERVLEAVRALTSEAW